MFGHRDDRGFIFLHLADRLANTFIVVPSDIEIDDREGRRVFGDERSCRFSTRPKIYAKPLCVSGLAQRGGNLGSVTLMNDEEAPASLRQCAEFPAR